jgi:cytochrome P450
MACSFPKVFYYWHRKLLFIFIKEVTRYRGAVESIVGIKLLLPFDLHKFVAANISHRAMSQDEEVYPNPSRFDPGRHFTADGNLKDEPTYNHFGFGFGRFAMSSVFLFWEI